MADFFTLVKVQFLSFFGLNKILHSKKSRKISGVGGLIIVLLVMGAAIGYFGYIYAESVGQSLLMNGNIAALIPVMIALGALVSFFFSFYAVGNVLFGFKDYDMLMSMPIKPRSIVLSKFLFLYVSDLVFSLLIIVPSFVVYFNFSGALSVTEILFALVMTVFSPLMPLALSTVVGMVVSFISSRFRKKNIVQIILLFLFLIGVFALSFVSGFAAEDGGLIGVDIAAVIGKIYFILPIAIKGFTDWFWWMVFLGINLSFAFAVILFVCVFYKKLNTVFTAKRTLRKFEFKYYGTSGVGKTLFVKELRRLFSCPVYAVNSLCGAVLSVVMSIVYAVLFLSLRADYPEIAELFAVLNRMLPLLFTFMFLLAPTTNCSVSLEGQSLWIVKTAPVPVKKIYNAKLLLNTVFGSVPAFVVSLSLAICTGMNVLDAVLLVVIALAVSQFGGIFGLIMNLCFPKLKWENENIPVKQGLPTFLTVLCGFVFSIIIGLVSAYLNVSLTVLFGIYAAFFVILTVMAYALLLKFGKRLFDKLN